MLDIKFIRENPDLVKQSLKNRGKDVDVDRLLELDSERRELQQQLDACNAEKNTASKEIGKGGDKTTITAQMKKVDEKADKLQEQTKEIKTEFETLLTSIPNIPRDDVPVGESEDDNQVIRSWGEPPRFDFEPKDHAQLGKELGIIDTDTSAVVSGSRFNYLKNEAVLLQFALLQFGLSVLTNEDTLKKISSEYNTKPFIPVLTPDMIRSDIYRRMGRLTDDNADDKYHLAEDDLYLAGSAEHGVAPMHLDHVFSEKELPVRYVGYSTAFRREAGTYGKDTSGIFRRHQFDKLEMFSFNHPDESDNEQYFFVAIQEYLMQQLELPYQVVHVCTGDMGPTNARHIDINTWMPGQQQFRETHTSDMNTDYQARGLNTKFKTPDSSKALVHTNDATVFAMGRTLIAIIENYQQKDGTVKVPEALVPYTGFDTIHPKN